MGQQHEEFALLTLVSVWSSGHLVSHQRILVAYENFSEYRQM